MINSWVSDGWETAPPLGETSEIARCEKNTFFLFFFFKCYIVLEVVLLKCSIFTDVLEYWDILFVVIHAKQ